MTKVKLIFAVVLAVFMNCALADDLEDSKQAYLRQDYALALQLLRPLAEQGNLIAQYRIGLMTFRGNGVQRDVSKAISNITACAEGGVPEAQAFMAFIYISKNDFIPTDFSKAVHWAKLAANQGNEIGMAVLAMLFLNGQGVEQDTDQALSLLQKAAAKNNVLAQYELGKMMLVGRGLPQDKAQGELLLKRSAIINTDFAPAIEVMLAQSENLNLWRQGSARLMCDSLICAGSSGYHGKRMKTAYEEMQWVELASRVLSIGDRSDLLYFYLGRSSEGVGDLNSAVTYYKLALNPKERGRPCAGFVNNCLGIDVPLEADGRRNRVLVAINLREETEAKRNEIIRKANEVAATIRRSEELAADRLKEYERDFQETLQLATEGQLDAQLKISHMYFSGTGVDLDDKVGMIWLLKAANSGGSEAQFRLSEVYFSGAGAAVDNKIGMKWLVTAADSGSASAQYRLGTMYDSGRMVEKSQTKAEGWFKKAAAQGVESARLWLDALEVERKEIAATAKKRADAAAKKMRMQEVEKKQEADRMESLQREADRKRILENAKRLKSL